MSDIMLDFKLYEAGKDYNRKLTPDYYKTIDINEKFDNNIHWDGVKANGQPALIFPIYSRTADFEIASILSSPIKMKFSIKNDNSESQDEAALEKRKKVENLNHACESKWEEDKLDSMLRDLLRDGFNSGDYCIYTYWDESIDTKQTYGITPGTEEPTKIMGDFVNEIKDGSDIMFGNPNDRRVQTQPYILIGGRGLVEDLKKKAKANGIPEKDYINIVGDADTSDVAGERGKLELDSNSSDEAAKCNYVIKVWKKDGHVYYRQSTKYCMIVKEKDMRNKRYPLAWGSWKKRKNSYHGMAPGTALVPNQVAINKAYSSIMFHLQQTAFGKVAFDSTKIAEWDTRVGSAIPMNGDVSNAVIQLPPGQMNTQMPSILDGIVTKTKELNGASDAGLGDINPEQASGVSIAYTQKANAIPLNNPRDILYDFVEDLALNWQDFIESKYTVPRQVGYKEKGVSKTGEINGQDYKDIPLSIKIDVGPSMMWSEVTSVNTLNNLLANNRISFLQYLERLPDGFIDDKQGLIEEIKAQMEQQQAMAKQQQQAMMQQQGQMQQQQQGQQAQEQQMKEAQYEKMALFMESLSEETQKAIKQLPTSEQQEQAILKLMHDSIGNSMKPQ